MNESDEQPFKIVPPGVSVRFYVNRQHVLYPDAGYKPFFLQIEDSPKFPVSVVKFVGASEAVAESQKVDEYSCGMVVGKKTVMSVFFATERGCLYKE